MNRTSTRSDTDPQRAPTRPRHAGEPRRGAVLALAVRRAGCLATWITSLAVVLVATAGRAGRRSDRGQGTVEYALILLGAAAIALVVVAWVTRSDAIGRLFDTVLARVLQQAG